MSFRFPLRPPAQAAAAAVSAFQEELLALAMAFNRSEPESLSPTDLKGLPASLCGSADTTAGLLL